MSTGWRGVITGALGLITLEVVLSSSSSTQRVASAGTDLAGLVVRLVDPTVPAIAKKTTTTPTTPTPITTPTTNPAVGVPVAAGGGAVASAGITGGSYSPPATATVVTMPGGSSTLLQQ